MAAKHYTGKIAEADRALADAVAALLTVERSSLVEDVPGNEVEVGDERRSGSDRDESTRRQSVNIRLTSARLSTYP